LLVSLDLNNGNSMKLRIFLIYLMCLFFVLCIEVNAETILTKSHIDYINSVFKQNGIKNGYVELDQYGRLKLNGLYENEAEVDKAFSIAQSVVGVKWVSPVTPENIKVKEWENNSQKYYNEQKYYLQQ